MKATSMKKQQGFTIIELVVVILLLGILTATALPRFMDVTTQAHTAVVQGVQGSLQTGVAMFNASWTAMSQPAEDTRITAFGDGSMRTNAQGFPQGNGTNGITADATGANECVQVYRELLQVGGTPTVANTGLTALPSAAVVNASGSDFIAYVAGTTTVTCNYVYTEEPVVAAGRARLITYNPVTGGVTLGQTAALP
jgi:MSHA pilin protein MshB